MIKNIEVSQTMKSLGAIVPDGWHAGYVGYGPQNSGMTTGFLSTKPLLPVLTDTGQLELAPYQDAIPDTKPIGWINLKQ